MTETTTKPNKWALPPDLFPPQIAETAARLNDAIVTRFDYPTGWRASHSGTTLVFSWYENLFEPLDVARFALGALMMVPDAARPVEVSLRLVDPVDRHTLEAAVLHVRSGYITSPEIAG